MARLLYGCTAADYTITSGGRVIPNTELTVWDAIEGGTQITDLTDYDGNAVGTVTSEGTGFVRFYGPDGENDNLWLDSGQNSRVLVRPTVITADLGDGSILDEDINADANIGRSKIAGTALTTTSTGVFSVLDYGADPTGVADSTTAIQAAIAAMSAGDTLLFPPGTYLTDLLTFPDDTTRISGYGATIKPIATVDPALTLIHVTGDGVVVEGLSVDADEIARFCIKVGADDGSGAGATLRDVLVTNTVMHGIWGAAASDLTIDRVTMTACGRGAEFGGDYRGSGLYAHGCQNLTVTDSLTQGSREHGMYINGETATGATIAGCRAIGNGVGEGTGVGISMRQSGSTVTGCYASGNSAGAFAVSWPIQLPAPGSGSDVTVTGCVFGWSTTGADREVTIVGMDDVTLTGNIIVSAGAYYALRVGEASTGSAVDGLVSGNRITQTYASGYGAVLVESNGWTVSGNRLQGDGTHGAGVRIAATVTTGATVIGNRIEGFDTGVYLPTGASDYAIVASNIFSACVTADLLNLSSGIHHTLRLLDANGERKAGGPYALSGTGSPEGAVIAPPGSVFTQTDDADLGIVEWNKATGTGNTGWLPDYKGRWKTYVPTWTGSGGTPDIGNGVLTGRYTITGNILHFTIRLVFGSTTNANSATTWSFTLPANVNEDHFVGVVMFSDADVGKSQGHAISTIGTNVLAMQVTNYAGYAKPFTWVQNDYMQIGGTAQIG